MKTKIINTIREWIPESLSLIPDINCTDETVADYQLLHKLATVCIQKISLEQRHEIENVKEIVKIINLLYERGNQYTRNAIENEFLTPLTFDESPGSLKRHLDLFPSELREGYIKTILQN